MGESGTIGYMQTWLWWHVWGSLHKGLSFSISSIRFKGSSTVGFH